MVEALLSQNRTKGYFVIFTLTSILTYFFAFFARYIDPNLSITSPVFETFLASMIINVLLQLAALWYFKLARALNLYFSINDLVNLTSAIVISSALFFIICFFVFPFPATLPRLTYLLNPLFSMLSFGFVMLSARLYREIRHKISHTGDSAINTLIIGAGALGTTTYQEIRNHYFDQYNVLGFLDDSSHKLNMSIQGVKVLGLIENLEEVLAANQIETVIIAINKLPQESVKHIMSITQRLKVNCFITQSIHSRLQNKSGSTPFRKINIEDLLGRQPIQLDDSDIRENLRGEVVMVTGAGGSIGSELCRQIASFGAKKIVLFDNAESPLFEIDRELRNAYPYVETAPFIGDMKNTHSLKDVFELYKPKKVYHAAAYKHVPLMESHPDEAILNNVLGTKQMIEFSIDYDVEKFVMISTDKAVRPTNIMGATKRCAELMISSFVNREDVKTKFSAVRFGNVLGSNGSVVPIFQKQIDAGGPITITHPDITRYFMTIPEAVQLVLQSGTMGDNGDIFILDMGEPIKIVDLAKNMIELSGKTLGRDINIEYTGLRPGEKLYEELVAYGEEVDNTKIEKISVQRHGKERKQFKMADVENLIMTARIHKGTKVVPAMLWETLKKYDPDV